MKIKNHIKQNKFDNDTEKAIVNIAFTQSYFYGKINTALKNTRSAANNLTFCVLSKVNTLGLYPLETSPRA